MFDMQENQRETPKSIQPPTRKQALLLFVIAAAGLIASSFISAFLPPMEDQAHVLLVNLVFYLGFIGLPCLLVLRRGPGQIEALRPNPISPFNVFSIAVLAVLAVFFINDILVLWSIPFQKLGFNVNAGGLPTPGDTRSLVLCILYAAVLPGIFEELLFRGVMLSAFEAGGTRRAIRFTALLFALLHGSVIGLPGQFLLGMLIAELVICCDSIYAGLIFHTAYNAAAVIIQYYQSKVLPEAEVIADYFTALGGWSGVMATVISILFTGAMMRFSLRMFRLRAQVHGIVPVPDQPRLPMHAHEKLLLAAGLLFAALLYGTTIYAMLTT